MPSRRFAAFSLTAMALSTLAACGGTGSGNSSTDVTMRDMEVVDGTASDAMTDLDGVQSEGTAMAPVATNVSEASNAPKASSNSAAASNASEDVVAGE